MVDGINSISKSVNYKQIELIEIGFLLLLKIPWIRVLELLIQLHYCLSLKPEYMYICLYSFVELYIPVFL
jgi:hypothetical protein